MQEPTKKTIEEITFAQEFCYYFGKINPSEEMALLSKQGIEFDAILNHIKQTRLVELYIRAFKVHNYNRGSPLKVQIPFKKADSYVLKDGELNLCITDTGVRNKKFLWGTISIKDQNGSKTLCEFINEDYSSLV